MIPEIFVINLPQARQRRRQVEQQLDALDLSARLFDAFDGLRGATQFERIDEHGFELNTGRLPSPGEIGCFASHRRIWQRCADGVAPVCVLEDDCRLAPFFGSALETAARQTTQYGFIRLQTETRAKKRLVGVEGAFRMYRYTKMAHSTLAYVISPAVAACLVEKSRIIDAPVDVFIKRYWNHGQLLYGLTPYAASESESGEESYIGDRHCSAKPVSVRVGRAVTKLRWFARRTVFNLRSNH